MDHEREQPVRWWSWAEAAVRFLGPLRARAKELGYVLALHGGADPDVDLLVVPWEEGAVAAEELLQELMFVVRAHNDGVACWIGPGSIGAGPGQKTGEPHPHGRSTWVIDVGHVHLNISVMPLFRR